MSLFPEKRCETPLEERLVCLLARRGYTVTTAESCTGGLLSGTIVNVAGASEVLNEAFVTYSNDAKHRLLAVNQEKLDTVGAVSPETAKQMALGAARVADADVAISTTGVAGPGGGSTQKPVGLIYIGCCVKGKVEVRECRFHGDRKENRFFTVQAALELAVEMLLNEEI